MRRLSTLCAALPLALCFCAPSFAAKRLPTIEDARNVVRLGAIAANSRTPWVAFERASGIDVVDGRDFAAKVGRITGNSPVWSPDGTLLAYVAMDKSGFPQIFVWSEATRATEQVTSLETGYSPNPLVARRESSRRISWSPDSRRIAFVSRPMDLRETALPRGQGNPRIYAGSAATIYNVWDGVFHKDWAETGGRAFEGDHALQRQRAIERDPSQGLNRLFIVDVATKKLDAVRVEHRVFAPTWLADARTLAVLVETRGTVDYRERVETRLGFVDLETRALRTVPTPMKRHAGPAYLAARGEIVLIGWDRWIGFPRLLCYSIAKQSWSVLETPKGLAVRDLRAAPDGRGILLTTPDRHVVSLWHVDLESGRSRLLETADTAVRAFDVGFGGQVFFTGESASNPSALYGTADDQKARLAFDPNPFLAAVALAAQRRLTWRNAAGDEVDGILILPQGYVAGRRYPVIVDVYPWQAVDGFYLEGHGRAMGQLEANRGYAVFRPALRAPHTIGNHSRGFEYHEKARGASGVDVLRDDFESGVRAIVEAGFADPGRIGIFGHSNGGYAANFLITETSIAKCAVLSSASSNAFILHSSSVPQGGWADEMADGDIRTKLRDYERLSPVLKMSSVHIPVLMIVGDDDWLTWLPEMIYQFNELRRFGKDVTLLRYAGEGHVFRNPQNLEDSITRIREFFDQCLTPWA